MSNYYNAVEMSPVLAPGPEATAPERFEGIYRMPSFVTIPTSDLTASVDFWTQGLDFFELFSVPGSWSTCAAGPSRTSCWCRPPSPWSRRRRP